jgi:hypothetical protein
MSRDELTRISLRIKIILYIILRFALQSQWKLDFFAPISLIEAKFQIVNSEVFLVGLLFEISSNDNVISSNYLFYRLYFVTKNKI